MTFAIPSNFKPLFNVEISCDRHKLDHKEITKLSKKIKNLFLLRTYVSEDKICMFASSTKTLRSSDPLALIQELREWAMTLPINIKSIVTNEIDVMKPYPKWLLLSDTEIENKTNEKSF